MIIYDNTKWAFNNDVVSNQIINKIYEAMRSKGFGASPSEINSWNNSMNFMRNILVFNTADFMGTTYSIS